LSQSWAGDSEGKAHLIEVTISHGGPDDLDVGPFKVQLGVCIESRLVGRQLQGARLRARYRHAGVVSQECHIGFVVQRLLNAPPGDGLIEGAKSWPMSQGTSQTATKTWSCSPHTARCASVNWQVSVAAGSTCCTERSPLRTTVELANGQAVFGPAKSEEGRRVVVFLAELVPMIEQHLNQHVAAAPDSLVFTSPEGNPLRRTKFRPHWSNACAVSNVTGLHFHDLRGSGATWPVSLGHGQRANAPTGTRNPRSIERKTPQSAYAARTKARPAKAGIFVEGCRVRHDKVDKWGKVTLRYKSRLFRIGVGRPYKGQRILLLVAGKNVRILTEDGDLIRELTIDESRSYQPQP
jgi:hypothetical protein